MVGSGFVFLHDVDSLKSEYTSNDSYLFKGIVQCAYYSLLIIKSYIASLINNDNNKKSKTTQTIDILVGWN